MLTRLLRAAARLNFAKRLDDGAAAPIPRDRAAFRSGSDDADRVLLIGNGIVRGWGVATHQLALTGQLGRSLTRRSGSPVDIDTVGDEVMNMATARSWLGADPLAGYALAVVAIGLNDAVRLSDADRWEADLEALLLHLELGMSPAAGIVVALIQPVRSVVPFDDLFGALGQRHADRLNALTAQVVGRHPGAVVVAMRAPVPDIARPLGSPETYAAWAEQLADAALPLLQQARGLVPRSAPTADPRDGLPEALRHVVDTAPASSALDRLVADATGRFGVDAAMVTLLSGERQFLAASTTAMPASVPRELTYCTHVVDGDAPMVVPDARKDERFKDNAYIELTHLPFYAGAPIHDASGEAIGTFCLFSAFPKSASKIDVDELTQFARLAEAELQRIGRTSPALQ